MALFRKHIGKILLGLAAITWTSCGDDSSTGTDTGDDATTSSSSQDGLFQFQPRRIFQFK